MMEQGSDVFKEGPQGRQAPNNSNFCSPTPTHIIITMLRLCFRNCGVLSFAQEEHDKNDKRFPCFCAKEHKVEVICFT